MNLSVECDQFPNVSQIYEEKAWNGFKLLNIPPQYERRREWLLVSLLDV